MQKLTVVADKEASSIISEEDSTVWKKNTKQFVHEEREKRETKNRAPWDIRGCRAGGGCGIGHMSNLGMIKEVRLEPGNTGSIKTEAMKFEKQEWMGHGVKGIRNIEEENSNILLLVKCLVPFVSAV